MAKENQDFDLHEIVEIIDGYIIHGIKDKFLEKYTFLIPQEVIEKDPKTIETIVLPHEEYKIINATSEDRYDFQSWREFDVIWKCSIGKIKPVKIESFKFKFLGVGYIYEKPKYNYQFEIIDPFKYHIKKVQDQRNHILKQNDLTNLLYYTSDYCSPNSLAKFTTVCGSSEPMISFNVFHKGNDIFNSNADIKNLIADLVLYKPYLFNFNLGKIYLDGTTIYSYFPSFYDKQYLLVASTIIQFLYNFWDKIGDLLYYYFNPGLKEWEVDFTRIIDRFPKQYKNDSFRWLEEFRNKEYKKLNAERKQIVHYTGLESKLYEEYITGNRDEQKMRGLTDWRDNLVRDFKIAFRQTILGFEHTLKLIESKEEIIRG